MHDPLVQIRLDRAGDPSGESDISRRDFMKVLAASMALVGVGAGCDRSPPSKILPFSRAGSLDPEAVADPILPGVPRYYATSMIEGGFAVGLLGRANEGRPTKIEGNPDHPSSLGASGVRHQASVLSLYDPDRARRVLRHGQPSSWDALYALLSEPRSDSGRGLRILASPSSSPTLDRISTRVRARHPEVKITYFSPAWSVENTLAGAELALKERWLPDYDLGPARVVVALDADFLSNLPGSLRYARNWATRKRTDDLSQMNRLYVAECMLSVTGTMADHRVAVRSSEIASIAGALASGPSGGLDPKVRVFVSALARDLESHPRGATLVMVGERQPPEVHALGWVLNARLGNIGKTVHAIASPLLSSDQDLPALTAEMRAKKVDTLLILEGNPVYGAPADLDLESALKTVRERIYLGAYEDETARLSTAFAPALHYLESWGDARAYDGTLSLVQPLITPLHDGRSAIEILSVLSGDRPRGPRKLVRETHHTLTAAQWNGALKRGYIEATASFRNTPTKIRTADFIARESRAAELEIDFYPSPTLGDGSLANNAWLLELPEPITKLTWGNAVLMSARTAAASGLEGGDRVEVRNAKGRSISGPTLIVPGHADRALSVWLGYGRTGAESLADRRGFRASSIQAVDARWFANGALRKIAGAEELARTQTHFEMEGRPIALRASLSDYAREPHFADEHKGPLPSLYPPISRGGLQWAMSIDLSICIGCSSCMVACQAENNVPVVGKENLIRRRQMHWLRIDTYFDGSGQDARAIHQPMMCQHCETAPCEYVCPVNATEHSPDGLNEMVYNRCVGTRFCSNNCPYKVRRFNWFNWTKEEAANQGEVELVHNPDVTVRDRGVMEKCTYCVQRIRGAEIRAELEKREVGPGDVVTACQQACPTGAIQFGSLSHSDSELMRRRAEPRSYEVLHDQGTRPRTTYLARIDNLTPELG